MKSISNISNSIPKYRSFPDNIRKVIYDCVSLDVISECREYVGRFVCLNIVRVDDIEDSLVIEYK